MILDGYHKLPRQDMYWEKSDDVAIPLVSTWMFKNRFKLIKQFFSTSESRYINANDKVWKLRPNDCSNKQISATVWHIWENIFCRDEYIDHHSYKMFIRRKLIRFGYRFWFMCSSAGYPHMFDVYCENHRWVIMMIHLVPRGLNSWCLGIAISCLWSIFWQLFLSWPNEESPRKQYKDHKDTKKQ